MSPIHNPRVFPDRRAHRRRDFLVQSAIGTTCFAAGWPLGAATRASGSDGTDTESTRLRFGLIADVHKDVMHDADARLRDFIETMTREDVDFIVQLGDFCVPKTENKDFLKIWNGFKKPGFHVLGNHDTDGGYKREQTVDWWGMPDRFYSFNQGGLRFIVLDGNDRPKDHAGGYPRFIAPDQVEWLESELAEATSRVIVFVHQSIERENQGGVQNGAAIRATLEKANRDAGFRKVTACFSGHHHRDYVRRIRDILYPQINSASYYWVGGDYQKIRYSPEIDASHPWIKYTVPYRDPIYALVTVDPARGAMRIDGKKSEFVGPAPWDLGETREHWDAPTLTASVSDWRMPF